MAVTKSWEREAAQTFAPAAPPLRRRVELRWLAGASLLVACGLALVAAARIGQIQGGERVVNLNTIQSADELALVTGPDTAPGVFEYLSAHRPVPNVGALAGKLPVRRLKPLLIVRTQREFLREYALWCSLYLAAFWFVHLAWRARRFRGDQMILPALHLLTGIGLILAVSLRDPLRDTLEFRKFVWGAAAGCLLLILPLFRGFNRLRSPRRIYTPLLAAIILFALLIAFGKGPTGSDARVNLGPFQPVEVIKVLIVFFLAGYFGQRWQWLRELRSRRLRWINLPRLAHALPVMAGVAVPLGVFFLLKDMGPALITGFLFLAMFAVARNRLGLALLGLGVLVGGIALGYRYGTPHTVVDRVSIWLSPWDNNLRGGDQVAHALWAFATGGALGSGPGLGDPAMIPAGHTDLVLPAIAEEWGFPGVAAIALLFWLLVQRTFRIALRARDEAGMFLAFGFGVLLSVEMLLISAGVLGAIPLSGVVSPFLSFGNTAMLANFFIFAVVLSISAAGDKGEGLRPVFRQPLRTASVVFAGLLLALVGRAAYFQLLHSEEYIARDTHVIEEDGVKRAQMNPRLNSLARAIPRGAILDRNGVPLALGGRPEDRQYPFGPATAHLLGDVRTGDNFHASNASLVEHDANATLRGFGDLHELARMVQYRHQPSNPAMRALLERNRNIQTTIDVRLQTRVVELLRQRLGAARKKGAVVVMDPHSGDVLALASYPMPESEGAAAPEELLDRARYGLYPPGSTFKLVTAIAGLRVNPELKNKSYQCIRLSDGRAGNLIRGFNRPIRDDVGDHPHGRLSMETALADSCNAYFAQLGTYDVGADALHETAELLEIPAGPVKELRHLMPMAAYGQGPVLVTPFKMARVAATIAAGGEMPEGRWVMGEANARSHAPKRVLRAEDAGFLQRAMRRVVEAGTARSAMKGIAVDVAGKTGTAQVETGAPHSWFAGYAPYGDSKKQLAFAVVVEHGGYGAEIAAPLARDIVQAARELGII